MKAMKKFALATLVILGTGSLSACQLGVLELDIGMGFEPGAYVVAGGEE